MLKRTAAALGIFLLLCLVYAFAEPRVLLDLQLTEAAMPNLPESWNGERVALVADFQIGMWLDNDDMVNRVLVEAQSRGPKAILIAGDFVYHPDSSVVDRALHVLEPLVGSDIPVFAVLGNHDYSVGSPGEQPRVTLANYLEAQLESAGITVLENEAVLVDSVYIVGLGSAWANRANPAKALEGVPEDAARIIFMHNPITYRELPPHSAPLALAAHTHGGQIRIPLTPSESWLDIARSREVIADGWAVDSMGAAGNRAYVNRGIGFSLVPLRFRCRPELTMMTVRRGKADVDPGEAD